MSTRKWLTNQQKGTIKALALEGLSLENIGFAVGCSRKCVFKWIQRHGIHAEWRAARLRLHAFVPLTERKQRKPAEPKSEPKRLRDPLAERLAQGLR